MNKQEIKEFINDFKIEYWIKRDLKNKRVKKHVANWRIKNPEKEFAQRRVFVELRAGRIEKLPCDKCGEIKRIEAHHEDYSQPLNIIWLCKKHHVIADIERRKRLTK